jgi:hypothetical protein
VRPRPGQVLPLLSLRWRMLRKKPIMVGLGVAAMLGLLLLLLGIVGGSNVPVGEVSARGFSPDDLAAATFPDHRGEVAVLIPTAMLAFGLLCLVAPVAAGGGYELFPESELVSYPVRVSTLVRMSLVLSPLNVAWYVQVLLLTAATAYSLRGPHGPTPPILVLLLFLAACTSVGQALGWGLVGVRRTRNGRNLTWVLLAAVVGLVGWVIATDRGAAMLDAAPTKWVVLAQLQAAKGDFTSPLPLALALLAAVFVGYLVSVRVAAWALRRPGDLGVDGPLARPVRRRDVAATPARELLRVDHASVWRSPPLRRGLLVLAVLPVAAAALASLPWSSIALLPPLVASGAALLFGVNALSLDGSGAVWVSTLPHDPALVLRSKARVVAEVVSGAVLIVLVGAAVRASSAPDLVDVVSVIGACVSCVALVVASCMRLSVTRPHRAELRGARDTPAPPGAMALYSLRLASVTTCVGLVFSVATLADVWQFPVCVTMLLLAWSLWSWTRTRRLWEDPHVRVRVVTTVAAG